MGFKYYFSWCTKILKSKSRKYLNGGFINDDAGLEVDCVVKLKDGRHALIECKLARTNIDEGAKNLIKLNSMIEKKGKCKNLNFQQF